MQVTFTVDADGLLTVTAREATTGTTQHIEVKPSYGLPPEEMERMLRESIEHARADIMGRLLVEARVEAERKRWEESGQLNFSAESESAAVIDAAAEYGRALPMMMTAAGTVPAAKAFIMGVGVAGLQAIATARRLGCKVEATDVRAFMSFRRADDIGGRSLMRALAGLRSFGRFLEREGKGKVGALSAIRAPKIGKSLPKPIQMTAARQMTDADIRAGENRGRGYSRIFRGTILSARGK